MCAGALRDLGLDESVFLGALDALGLPGGLDAGFRRGSRRGISGWKFEVGSGAEDAGEEGIRFRVPAAGHERAAVPFALHSGGAGHHEHGRTHAEIRELIGNSALSDEVKTRALSVFHRIAVAEGKIHGVPPEDVGFHEVGAEDSIADIVAVCAGIAALAPDRVLSSVLVEGSGFVECAHGQFPLPAPATLALLEGIPLRQEEAAGERITPTGAAILAEFCGGFGPMPEMRVSAIGYGLGTRDGGPRPNVLRAVLGEASAASDCGRDEVCVVESNIDDCSPELIACACEALRSEGALDVWTTPAAMKKGRSGLVVHALAQPGDEDRIAEALIRETSSFGARIFPARRLKLPRDFAEVETAYGKVKIKRGWIGGEPARRVPELDSCAEVARAAGVPVRDVYLAAEAACK